jgi:hypothetical protein
VTGAGRTLDVSPWLLAAMLGGKSMRQGIWGCGGREDGHTVREWVGLWSD